MVRGCAGALDTPRDWSRVGACPAVSPIAKSVTVMSYIKGRRVLGGDVMCALDAAFETISSSSLQQCSLKCGRDATCAGFNIKNSITCDIYDRKPTIISPVTGCTFYQVDSSTFLLCMNCLTRSTPEIFLVLLEIFGFIVFCDFIFIRLINFTTAIVFKPIVNTVLNFCVILIVWHYLAYIVLTCR